MAPDLFPLGVDRLRAVVASLARSDDPEHRWLGTAIAAGLDGRCSSFKIALGLRPGPGQRGPRTVAGLADRDERLRLVAVELFPGLSRYQQGREIYRIFHGYETSAWLRERDKVTCPRRAGTPEAHAWRYLASGHSVLSAERTRKILAAS